MNLNYFSPWYLVYLYLTLFIYFINKFFNLQGFPFKAKLYLPVPKVTVQDQNNFISWQLCFLHSNPISWPLLFNVVNIICCCLTQWLGVLKFASERGVFPKIWPKNLSTKSSNVLNNGVIGYGFRKCQKK